MTVTLADDDNPSLSVALIVNVYVSCVSLSSMSLLYTSILLVLGWKLNIVGRDETKLTLLGSGGERKNIRSKPSSINENFLRTTKLICKICICH